MKERIFLISFIGILFCTNTIASAQSDWQWQIHTSVYTAHYHYNPQHNDHQKLLNLEFYNNNEWLAGGALFENSFYQPSQYVYIGKAFHPIENLPDFHFKVTGGLIHGYKDPYKNKIPMNNWGVAPAVLPSIGYSYKQATSEVIFLGSAGLILTVGYKF